MNKLEHQRLLNEGLNPCCNGIYSMSELRVGKPFVITVLILVVMEYTQWVCFPLIHTFFYCLNPCCNGIYSMRANTYRMVKNMWVLILVVMEYTQWEETTLVILLIKVLILVVMEYTQWEHKSFSSGIPDK